MKEIGAFCETYGNTIHNRVLQFMLEIQHLDFAIRDMAKYISISKPKAHEIMKEFEKKGYAKKTRLVGKPQLYTINKNNKRVRIFMRNFRECLKRVIEEYAEKDTPSSSPKVGVASARNV